MNSYSVSIVVPVYKNEGSIEHLLNRIKEVSIAVTGSVEAVFVVDGSPDKSLEALRSSLPRDGFDAFLGANNRDRSNKTILSLYRARYQTIELRRPGTNRPLSKE